jgi:hypothetical protein
MDVCTVERPKLLIWSENTYKQKKNQNSRGRVKAGSRKGKGDEEGADLLLSYLFSEECFFSHTCN